MPSMSREYMSVPLYGLSLDVETFSAMTDIAAEMNIPLNDAIGFALRDWLGEACYPVDATQN